MSYIYGIFNEDTCLYIGQTKREPEVRFKEHKKNITNKKHKIKSLNKYDINTLDFRVLEELDTTNSFVLGVAECCYNSLYKPLNKCVIQNGLGKVTLARTTEDMATNILNAIR